MSDVRQLLPEDRMQEMVATLAQLRDSWVNLSLVLRDHLTERDSPQRDEVMTVVERYLGRLRESQQRPGP